MNIIITHNKNYTVITLHGERIDAASAVTFRKDVCKQMTSFHKIIILDLAKVTFIDSSGLGALVAAFKQLPSDGKLLICGAGQNVLHLLRLTRMDSIFALYPDVDSAMDTLR
ncbi:MAG: anti-sigma factor antagonist [Candidatus Electrothrix sp. AR3]|nr:anti-sigma factor antagonist [Candidatus Electrothrix sp. AR3]